MQALDGFALILGLVFVLSGYRTIKKRSTHTNLGRFEGRSAVNLGWFWITLGVVFISGIVFDIKPFKSYITFFFERHR